MKVLVVALMTVVMIQLIEGRDIRVRRGFKGSGYERNSDERDASVSQERGCNGDIGRGYGNNFNSDSRELPYKNNDSGSSERFHGGRSFSRASASAAASSFSGNQRANLVELVKPKQ